MSAIPAFGHQVMYKLIMVIVIICKVYHVVLVFFYFDLIFKCSFKSFNLCFVIQQILPSFPGADVQLRLGRWCCLNPHVIVGYTLKFTEHLFTF
jgi:hypothetical protein